MYNDVYVTHRKHFNCRSIKTHKGLKDDCFIQPSQNKARIMDRTHKEVKKERNGRGETVRTFSAEHSFVKVRVF